MSYSVQHGASIIVVVTSSASFLIEFTLATISRCLLTSSLVVIRLIILSSLHLIADNRTTESASGAADGCAFAAAQSDDATRKQALTRLQSRDADERLAACVVLAEIGKQEDLPFLQSHLFDDDGRIRATAEAAIWAVWSRSTTLSTAGRTPVRLPVDPARDGRAALAPAGSLSPAYTGTATGALMWSE